LILTIKSNWSTQTYNIEETYNPSTITVTSVLWLSVPFLFWVTSHLSFLNLFVDRYFIPKESALVLLVAYGFNLISQKFPKNSENISLLGALTLSVILILINTKRAAFGLNKDTNYHHSLIIKESYPKINQPITIEGDPKYFPNAYLNRNEYLLLIKDKDLKRIYNKFSKKLNIGIT
jgi:hypothetical protein